MIENIFDSHSHYTDNKFDNIREDLLKSLPSKGVVGVINVGANIEESVQSTLLAKQYDYVYASIGVHPHEAEKLTGEYIGELENLSKRSKVVAIGEIGLDYHYDFSPRDVQKKVFIDQLSLASDLNLPVIIHAREADKDTIDILKRYNLKGVVHCFSGGVETAQIMLKLGYHIGVTGVVTFKNARRICDVVKYVSIDKILVETDCPYMAPEPFRGGLCDSSMISEIIKKIAQIKNMSPQDLSDITCKNTKILFNI